MNPIQKEQESVSAQVDTILANRHRRFKWLMKNDRVQDAVAIGEEFTEWMIDIDEEEILYFRLDDLMSYEGNN